MERVQKEQIVSQLQAKFAKATACIVTSGQGMTVESVNTLRRRLDKVQVEYVVSKNTLTRRAIANTDFAPLKDHFKGVSAIGFAYGDPSKAAKVLHDFCKEDEKLTVKFGFMVQGQVVLKPEEVAVLATLPSREELLAKVAYLLRSQHTRFVSTLNEIIGKFVRTVGAVHEKKSSSN